MSRTKKFMELLVVLQLIVQGRTYLEAVEWRQKQKNKNRKTCGA
jgi:hypothetical protein